MAPGLAESGERVDWVLGAEGSKDGLEGDVGVGGAEEVRTDEGVGF